MIDRRMLLTGSLAVLAVPLAAEAQQAGKAWRVGILATANPRVYDNLVDELRKLGYIDGQNVSFEFRSAGTVRATAGALG
jgi:hypothetical protein